MYRVNMSECTHPMPQLTDDEIYENGDWIEYYECHYCGATGHIHGDDRTEPNEWNYIGQVWD